MPAPVTIPLPTSDTDTPPRRIPVIPAARDRLTGNDGRNWRYDAAATLAAINTAVEREGAIVLDENHSSVHAAPNGQPSPAMARLTKFSMGEDGTIYGEAEWTAGGIAAWRAGSYHGISPSLLIGTANQVVGLHSVGMVNRPNLRLPIALNAATGARMPENQTPNEKTVAEQIAEALAPVLAAVAGFSESLSAVSKTVTKVEANMASVETNAAGNAADQFVETAITAGKIARDDATKAAWRKAYLNDRETATAQVAGLSAMAPQGQQKTIAPNANQHTSKSLTAEETKMADSLGIPRDKFVPRRLAHLEASK